MSDYPIKSRPFRARETKGWCDICGEKLVCGQKLVYSEASKFPVHYQCAQDDVIRPGSEDDYNIEWE